MSYSGANIYKNARIKAGLKRDPAAEELGVATRTLDKYESFELRVPDDIVRKMCLIYGDRNLAWRHLKKSELGEFLPDIPEVSVQSAVLGVADDFLSFEKTYRAIITIAADGRITETEKARWKRLQEEISDFAASLLALASCKKSE